MPQVLVLYCHPDTQRSRINRALRGSISTLPGVTVHDLYSAYPHGFVDVRHEQALLLAHDVIVMQFPIYWYSTPPLLKAWQDDVLEHGFAFGAGGDKLKGKSLLLAASAGGGPEDYDAAQGQFTLAELLRPLESTACLCGMVHRGISHIGPAERQTPEMLATHVQKYRNLIEGLTQGRLPPPFGTLASDAAKAEKLAQGAARPPVPETASPESTATPDGAAHAA